MEGKKLTISVAEAAEMLGINRNLAYDLARQEKLPGVIFLGNKRMVVSVAAIDRLLNSEQRKATNISDSGV